MNEIEGYKIADVIYKTFSITFLVVGLITNLISAIIYSKKKMRKSSYSVYLLALAIVDLFVILNGNSRLVLMSFLEDTNYNSRNTSDEANIFKGYDIRETSIVVCRLHMFFTYYSLELSSCILCLLSIDRFFGIVLALKAFRFNRSSIAHKVICITVFLLAFINLHFLIGMGYHHPANSSELDNKTSLFNSTIIQRVKCEANPNNAYYFGVWRVYFFFDSIVYSIIPFLIMITCNVFIIAKIVKSRVRSKQVIRAKTKILTSSHSTSQIVKNTNSMLATEKRISIILVGISFSFLILTTPVFIIEQLNDLYPHDYNWDIILACSYMLMYLNHVINFFFYCLTGPKFRNEVKKLFPRFLFKNNNVNPIKTSKSRYNTVFLGSTTKIGINKETTSYIKPVLRSLKVVRKRTERVEVMFSSAIVVSKKKSLISTDANLQTIV